MSEQPTVKSINFSEPEARPVLGPAGNKTRYVELRKPKTQKSPYTGDSKGGKSPPIRSPVETRKSPRSAASILRQGHHSLSMNASCSSDASTESSHSRASTGRIVRRTAPPSKRKQQCSLKGERIEKIPGNECDPAVMGGSLVKKRCAWVTSNTDPLYTAFHDEEWGLPVHNDKKLFELLSFSTALAELTWPAILSKRLMFRDVFLDFDPIAVSKLNDKRITSPGSPATSLLSEVKLRAIIENARQICKIIDEMGSFERYIWGFVNYKPIISEFRYHRQVPIKTSKADAISKDLVWRGFRGVGPTVVYSFMQVAGITNDHLISCFRYHDCITSGDSDKPVEAELDELSRDIDDLNLWR